MLAGLNGDGPAYTNLLRALVPVLKRFFARRTNGLTSEIDDLVQETLMAIHERRSSYDRERPFTAWLFSIARYKMIDYFRRNRLTQSVEGLQDILVSEGFEESSNASLDIETILGTLPVKQARAIRDTRLLGMSVAEAASRSGLGQSDIKVSVHRGMRTLNTKFAAAL
jgi:RNA polymerase sigma-70 factor (ECF subfamily)